MTPSHHWPTHDHPHPSGSWQYYIILSIKNFGYYVGTGQQLLNISVLYVHIYIYISQLDSTARPPINNTYLEEQTELSILSNG